MQYPPLYCNSEEMSICVKTRKTIHPRQPLPDLDIQSQDNVIEVRFRNDREHIFNSERVLGGHMIVIPEGEDFARLAHRLITEELGMRELDIRQFQDGCDQPLPHLTPDDSYVTLGRTHLVELKTKRFLDTKSYDNVCQKYDMSRYSPRMQFCSWTMMVSPSGIMVPANYEIPDTLVWKICLLCTVGKILRAKVSPEKFGATLKDSIFPALEGQIRPEEPLFIDEKMMTFWDELPAYDLLNDLRRSEYVKRNDQHKLEDFRLTHFRPELVVEDEMILPIKAQNKPMTELIMNTIARECFDRRYSSERKDRRVHLEYSMETYITQNPRDVERGLWNGIILGETSDDKIYNKNVEVLKRKGILNQGAAEISRRGKKMVTLEPDVERYGRELIKNKQRRDRERVEMELFYHDTNYYNYIFDRRRNDYEVSGRERIDGTVVEYRYQDECWYQSQRFQSALLREICINRASAKTKNWKGWWLFKVGDYDAYVAMSNKGTDEHNFYYVLASLAHMPLNNNSWKHLNDSWYYTNAVQSVNGPKLDQRVFSFERLYMMRCFFDELFTPERSRSHFVISYLLNRDATQSAIDILQLHRYSYMEMTKPSRDQNPCKILNKIDFPLRTPVQRFFMSLMVEHLRGHCVRMLEHETQRCQLVSWVDGQSIRNVEEMLALSYMHYSLPAARAKGVTSIYKITMKLIKEESTLDDQIGIGYNSDPASDVKDHDFNASYVCKLGRMVGELLRQRYPDYQTFESSFSSDLLAQKFSDFSTFKKSTDVSNEDKSTRIYAFEALSKIFGEIPDGVDSPYEDIQRLLDLYERDDFNNTVSIFMKDQITGVREIFVLGMLLRMLIKILEIFSEKINREVLSNETMSVPDRKMDIVNEHRSIAAKRLRDHSINSGAEYQTSIETFSASSDSKTWCQQFCMPNFGCLIHAILHSAYGRESRHLSHLFMRILNCVTSKEIVFPKTIHDWFKLGKCPAENSPEFQLFSQVVQGLEMNGMYGMANRTNMMQGILHHTSSLLHAAFLTDTTKTMKMVLKSHLSGLTGKYADIRYGEVVSHSMVSSDDSGIILSVPVAKLRNPDNLQQRRMNAVMKQIDDNMTMLGVKLEESKRLIGAKVSYEKTTLFSRNDMFEFNSQFWFRGKIYHPLIKFCTNCITVGYNETLLGSVDEGLSFLTDGMKRGLPQTLLDQLQLITFDLRRSMMFGSRPFDGLERLVSSPIIGHVPLVPPGLIGILDLDGIAHLSVLLQHRNSDLFVKRLQMRGEAFDEKLKFCLNLSKKYREVRKRFEATKESVDAELLNMGILVLKKPFSERLKIKMKIMSSGAKVALSFITISKMIAASSYACNHDVVFSSDITEKRTMYDLMGDLSLRHVHRPDVASVPADIENLLAESRVQRVLVEGKSIDSYHSFMKIPIRDGFRLSEVKDELNRFWSGDISPQTLELVRLIKEKDGRIGNTFEETLRNVNGSPLEMLSLFRLMSGKDRYLAFFSSSKHRSGLLEGYQSYIKDNMSLNETYTKLDANEVVVRPRHQISSQDQWNSLSPLLSMYFLGWKSCRNSLMVDIRGVLRRLDVNRITSKEDLILWVAKSQLEGARFRQSVLVNILEFVDRDVTSFPLSDKSYAAKKGNTWYLVEHNGGNITAIWKRARDPYYNNSYGIHQIINDPDRFWTFETDRLWIGTSNHSVDIMFRAATRQGIYQRFSSVFLNPFDADEYSAKIDVNQRVFRTLAKSFFSLDSPHLSNPRFYEALGRAMQQASDVERAIYNELRSGLLRRIQMELEPLEPDDFDLELVDVAGIFEGDGLDASLSDGERQDLMDLFGEDIEAMGLHLGESDGDEPYVPELQEVKSEDSDFEAFNPEHLGLNLAPPVLYSGAMMRREANRKHNWEIWNRARVAYHLAVRLRTAEVDEFDEGGEVHLLPDFPIVAANRAGDY